MFAWFARATARLRDLLFLGRLAPVPDRPYQPDPTRRREHAWFPFAF